nr:ATP synthase F0 subunit 8 [Coptosoma bifarium]
MPQMSPLWWEYLYLYFLGALMLIIILNYHTPNNVSTKMKENSSKINEMNWEW